LAWSSWRCEETLTIRAGYNSHSSHCITFVRCTVRLARRHVCIVSATTSTPPLLFKSTSLGAQQRRQTETCCVRTSDGRAHTLPLGRHSASTARITHGSTGADLCWGAAVLPRDTLRRAQTNAARKRHPSTHARHLAQPPTLCAPLTSLDSGANGLSMTHELPIPRPGTALWRHFSVPRRGSATPPPTSARPAETSAQPRIRTSSPHASTTCNEA
jgi:hypothetical protein